MLDFMRAGGFGMWPVLALGIATIAVAVRGVFQPAHASTRRLLSLSLATLFATGMAAASDLAAVMSKVPAHPTWSKSDELPLIVMMGLGESMAPVILGMLLLSLAWLAASFAGSGRKGGNVQLAKSPIFRAESAS